MSFADRLGQLAKDIGGAALAAPKFVWDVATAPWNDSEQFNGFKNTFVSAGANAFGSVIKPLADVASMPGVKPVLTKWDEINRDYIREPLTTAMLMQAQGLDFFDGSNWKKAHEEAQTTSFGQATYGAAAKFMPGQQEVEKVVDWTDPKSVDDYFNHGPQKIWSGIGDIGIQVFGDVAIGAGKIAKVAKGAEAVTNSLVGANSAQRRATAIEDVYKALAGEDNKYLQAAKDFAENDANYAYNHPMLQDSVAKDTIAAGFGAASSEKDALLVMLAGLGDAKAIDTMRNFGRQDIANPIARAQGELDSTAQNVLKGKYNEDGTPVHVFEDQNVLADVDAEINSLLQNNPDFAAFWQSRDDLSKTGSLTRTVGSAPMQAVDRFIAEGRASKFYDRKATDTPDVKIFKPTPFHRMYQIVSWPAGQRPSGHINLNDPESSRELVSVLQQAVSRKAIGADSARRIQESYLMAATPEERASVIYDMEEFVLNGLAEKHGVTLENAGKIYSTYKRARATAMSTLREKGYINDVDGTSTKVDLLESELVNNLPVMDFNLADGLLQRHNLKNDPWIGNQALGRILDASDDTSNIMDTMQSMFKIGALLRLGYTIRNSAEAQLRIASSVGSLAAVRHLGGGVKNLIYNSKNQFERTVDRFNPMAKDYNFYKTQHEDLGVEIEDIQRQVDALNNKIENDRYYHSAPYEAKYNAAGKAYALDRTKPRTVSEDFSPNADDVASLDALNILLDEKRKLQQATSDSMTRFEKDKRHMGQGTFTYKGVDGKTYELPDAFNESTFGDIHWRNSSAENSMLSLVDQQARVLAPNMVHTGYGEIKPDAPNYWTEWASTINRKLANSEVARRIAQGDNTYTVVSWMSSKEGKQLRDRLGLKTNEVREYVENVNSLMAKYAPDSELRQMILERKNINAEMLRGKFTNTSELPTINGNIIDENLNLTSQRKLQEAITGLFKLLGSMPEDAWARHPVYIDLYRKSLKRRIDDFNYLNKKGMELPVGPDAILSKDLADAMKAAHADALRGTKRILFTIDRRSNLAGASLIKFSSPFFAAYENSVKTWAKLAADKPQIINRANLIFTSPNRAGIATDDKGNPVPVEQASMNDYIWINIPEGIKKLPFVGKGLGALDNVGIQKRSLDVIFQGDMNIPVGPYVSIPVSEIVKAQPSTEESLKWAIPFGAERNAVTAMLPSWVKKQIIKQGGQSDPQYANTYTLIWQTEQYKRKQAGQEPASAEEIKAMADAYWNMRTVANLVLPFAPQFNSPYKMYIDKWRQYREADPKNAAANFWRDYGDDMFQFTMSLSKNNTGSQATTQDVANAQRYKGLVSDIAAIDPKMIGLVTSTGNGAFQFSDAAYKWQLQNTISAGSETTFRGRNDPAEAVKENNAQLGWIKYRSMMDYVDAQMQARGLTNIQSKKAKDLAAIKKQTVAFLAEQNPDWYKDFKDTDGSKYLRVRDAFNRILSDEKFMKDHGNDPTWKSVKIYLNARSQVEAMLAERKAAGLPGSIDAKKNADLANFLDFTANRLKQEDIGFGDLYDRYLSYDPVFDPNVPGVAQ